MEQSPHNAGIATGIGAVSFLTGAWLLAGSTDNIGVFNEDSNELLQLSLVLLVVSAFSILVGGRLIAHRVPEFLPLHRLVIKAATMLAAVGAVVMTVVWALVPNLHVNRLNQLGDTAADFAELQMIAIDIVHTTGMGLTIASLGLAAITYGTAVNAQGIVPRYVQWPVLVGAIWSLATGLLLVAQVLEPSWAMLFPTVVAGALFAFAVGSGKWLQSPEERH